jgi:hypothetical protein
LQGDLTKLDASIEEANAVFEANKAEWGWVSFFNKFVSFHRRSCELLLCSTRCLVFCLSRHHSLVFANIIHLTQTTCTTAACSTNSTTNHV